MTKYIVTLLGVFVVLFGAFFTLSNDTSQVYYIKDQNIKLSNNQKMIEVVGVDKQGQEDHLNFDKDVLDQKKQKEDIQYSKVIMEDHVVVDVKSISAYDIPELAMNVLKQ